MKKTINIGDKAIFKKKIEFDDVKRFAELSDDYNPIHIDDEYAKQSSFGRKICHGALINSYISKVLAMDLPGIGSIYLEQNTKFIKPVYIGDTILVEVIATEIKESRKGNIVSLSTNVYNQHRIQVIEGCAKVLKPYKEGIERYATEI